jgi:hypothetical protein
MRPRLTATAERLIGRVESRERISGEARRRFMPTSTLDPSWPVDSVPLGAGLMSPEALDNLMGKARRAKKFC